jgi:predicted phage baseplate assembly protein
VDDLAAISPDALVALEAMAYELDASEGTVRFGDGVRGRVPEAGMRIRLGRGRFGGGEAGNLPAGSLSEMKALRVDGSPAPALRIHQPLPCAGGAEPESLAEAERRIPARLRHSDRAVTSSDFERLSLEVPGLAVGRVEVLPLFKPHDRLFDMAGVVSVMALPQAAVGPAPWPRPDRPFLETLHAHLSSRVPLTTELYVIGCEYIPLGIATSLRIRPGFWPAQVLHDVEEALRRLLWPLPPGGGQGDGWALGRDVRDRELEVEISRVAGVREVLGVRLFGRAAGTEVDAWQALPRAGQDGSQTLVLEPWQLPELLTALVVDGGDGGGSDSVPTSLDTPPNPFASQQAVAVPVVPEVC